MIFSIIETHKKRNQIASRFAICNLVDYFRTILEINHFGDVCDSFKDTEMVVG